MKREFCQRLINLLNVLREMAILHYQQATSVQMLTDIGRDPAPARSRSVIQQIVIKLLAIHDR